VAIDLRTRIPEPLKLLEVISKYGEIRGRVALHRIVYIAQSRGTDLGYRFLNYSFGPYSKELDYDLQLLKRLGLVAIEEENGECLIKLTGKGAEVVKGLRSIKRGV